MDASRFDSEVWMVTDPSPGGSRNSFMYKVTAMAVARQAAGCQAEFESKHPRLHGSEEEANTDFEARVRRASKELLSLIGERPAVDLWTELRGRMSLDEIVGEVRNEIEADFRDPEKAIGIANSLQETIVLLSLV